MISKEERKKLLIEMMQEDEKNGMYEVPSKEETKLQSEQKEILTDEEREVMYKLAFEYGQKAMDYTKDFHDGINAKHAFIDGWIARKSYASQFKSQLPIEQKTYDFAINKILEFQHRYLEEYQPSYYKVKPECQLQYHVVDDLLDFIEEESQALPIEGVEREWISVEERLPEPCDKVTVALSDGCVLVGRLYSNGWSAFFMDGEQSVIERQVTHWQPLPSPPKNG